MKFLFEVVLEMTFIMCKSIEGLVGQLNNRLAGRLWLLGLGGAVLEHASILGPLGGQGNRIVSVGQDILSLWFGLRMCVSTERIVGRECGQDDY